MDAVQQILEIEAIKTLKARYFRCMDTKDWEGFGAVFTTDATLIFDLAVSTNGRPGKPAPMIEGRQAIVDTVAQKHPDTQTVHHGHMPEITLLSATAASGIWAMEDIVDYGHCVIHGYGHYHETYTKADGQWRIASVHLTRLRLSQQLKDAMVMV